MLGDIACFKIQLKPTVKKSDSVKDILYRELQGEMQNAINILVTEISWIYEIL